MTDTITLNTDEEIKESMDRHPASGKAADPVLEVLETAAEQTYEQKFGIGKYGRPLEEGKSTEFTPLGDGTTTTYGIGKFAAGNFLDWRTLDMKKFENMTVAELVKTLEQFNLEVRIQAAFTTTD